MRHSGGKLGLGSGYLRERLASSQGREFLASWDCIATTREAKQGSCCSALRIMLISPGDEETAQQVSTLCEDFDSSESCRL